MDQATDDWLAEGFHALLDWFYPPHCYHCGVPLSGTRGSLLCAACARWLADARIAEPGCPVCGLAYDDDSEPGAPCVNCLARDPNFDVARGVFTYAGPAAPLIRAFKFYGQFFLGPRLLDQVFESGWMPPGLEGANVVVPVPLHPRRERERGYDQARILARSLARHLRLPMLPRALRRVRYTDQQALLSSRQRWENVRGAFAPGRHPVERKNVLLVDDVMTTGATASECAHVLKKAGARGVCVLTLARVGP